MPRRAGCLVGELTLWLALLVGALPAQAQTAVLDRSPAARCMQPLTGAPGAPVEPDYPFDAWKQGKSGRVVVDLIFSSPAAPPKVSVHSNEGDDEFVRAVRDFAAKLRVACMEAGGAQPVQLRQEYVFQADQRRVQWSEPVDSQDGRRQLQLDCIKHLSGGTNPDYPFGARQAQVSGNVLAKLRFTAPDQPPEVEVFSRDSATMLLPGVKSWAQGYRMPCFEGPRPIESTWVFQFIFEGDKAVGFRPLELRGLLPHIRGIQKQTLDLDTTLMGCPFDLKFHYRQPFLPNLVGEIGPREPSRRPLLTWLEAQDLDMPSDALDVVYGDNTTLTVSCLKLQLNTPPKENK